MALKLHSWSTLSFGDEILQFRLSLSWLKFPNCLQTDWPPRACSHENSHSPPYSALVNGLKCLGDSVGQDISHKVLPQAQELFSTDRKSCPFWFAVVWKLGKQEKGSHKTSAKTDVRDVGIPIIWKYGPDLLSPMGLITIIIVRSNLNFSYPAKISIRDSECFK